MYEVDEPEKVQGNSIFVDNVSIHNYFTNYLHMLLYKMF